jgi:hypothetical protein
VLHLSEAIRLGSLVTEQISQQLFSKDFAGNVLGACALGAAYVAIGETGDLIHDPLEWDWIFKIHAGHVGPDGLKYYRRVDSTIIDLNDGEEYTREQIADWVESVERERGMWDEPVEAAEEECQAHCEEPEAALASA